MASPTGTVGRALDVVRRVSSRPDAAVSDGDIAALRRAAGQLPVWDPVRSFMLSSLATVHETRFRRHGQLGDLDAAIDAARDAADGSWPSRQARAATTLVLSYWLIDRFAHAGDLSDVDEALAAAQSAGDLAAAGSPTSRPSMARADLVASCLSWQSVCLRTRGRQRGNVADISHAVECGRRALDLAEPGSDTIGYVNNLAMALRARFAYQQNVADLNEAIALLRPAYDLPDDHHRPGAALANLCYALRTRFGHTGQLEDLDESIEAARRGLATLAPGTRDWVVTRCGLGLSLFMRFAWFGGSVDLDESIAAARDCLTGTPATSREHGLYLSNLLEPLLRRFERGGDLADLDEAVGLARQAIAVTAEDDPKRVERLSHLGILLRFRFLANGNPADLAEAVAACRDAVQSEPGAPESLAARLTNLAGVLAVNHQHHHVRADLDEAIVLCTRALGLMPPGHPDLAQYHEGMADMLAASYAETRRPAEAAQAVTHLRVAAQTAAAPAQARVVAARKWGWQAANLQKEWTSAADGHAAAVALLPLLAWHGLGRGDREQALAGHVALAADAAATALSAGRPEQAVELLDHGRGVLWSQMLDHRTDLNQLTATAPDLARQLQQVRLALDAIAPQSSRSPE